MRFLNLPGFSPRGNAFSTVSIPSVAKAKLLPLHPAARLKPCPFKTATHSKGLDHAPLLYGQVLVEDCGGQGFGVEVESERPVLVEAGEEQLAAGSHLLGGGGAEHLVDGSGPRLGD